MMLAEEARRMDAVKTGALIRRLRGEKQMTQHELARRLAVSEQAVSKWERGWGCPDVSLLRELAAVLGVDVRCILSGDMSPSERDGSNMRRIRFYVCPQCGNVIAMTGEAQVSCCGRTLEALKPAVCDEAHMLHMEPMDGEMYVTFSHEMRKEHHLQFVACVGYDRMLLVRLYAEQGSELRIPVMPRATYYVGCSRDGLFSFVK